MTSKVTNSGLLLLLLAVLVVFTFAACQTKPAAPPAQTGQASTPPAAAETGAPATGEAQATGTPSIPTAGETVNKPGASAAKAAPEVAKKSGKNRTVVFKTNKGTFEAEIFEDKAPLTAKNFITLVEKGFYNGIIFHRVIDGFMIQGGDPEGVGSGGPGYTIKDEFGPGLAHSSEGILSMANAGPDTGGSQFFITLGPTPHLDGKHAIFGKITKGMEVVRAIGQVEKDENDRPLEKVVMEKVSVKK